MTKVWGATSTTDDVLSGIDLHGKRVLVTGVSAGIGVETARALAAHGAQVTGAARDLEKAEAATAQVRKDAAANGGSFELVALDLASLKSVRACADRLMDKGEPFDVVIANAGVMATPFGHTVDGFETQFGTNHLGHFVLVNRIASLIRTGGRLVNLSSAGSSHRQRGPRRSQFREDALRPYGCLRAVEDGQHPFRRRLRPRHRGRGVRAAAVHPGAIQTELGRHMDAGQLQNLIDRDQSATGGGGKEPSSGRPFRRERRLRCGQLWLLRLTKSAAGIARTARSARSFRMKPPSPLSVKECEDMRSILITPRRSGRRARNWSESLFELRRWW